MRVVLLFALFTAGCGVVPTTGISRDDAIRIATQHVSASDPVLISATTGQSAPWGPADHPNVSAWIVRFTGNFPMPCPAPTANCPDLHTAVIVLDARNGEFISGTYQ